ncbi:MAG: ZIP family metal transporter [Capsulimonadaceae bacterium]|nr:ZIP family metal transporter [Capsulimonadaceae bacterium]
MHIIINHLGVILGIVAGLGNILGGLLVTRPWEARTDQDKPWRGGGLHALMQIGAGFLLAVTVLETIPWSLANTHPISWGAPLILGGYLLIHLFEHTIAPHFHFGEETHGSEMVSHSAAYSALFGLTVHSMFDGVAIGASVQLSHTLGWLVFIAILLHKFPEGATCSSIAMVAGLNRMSSFLMSVVIGFATLAGVALIVCTKSMPIGAALAVAAGVTLYVSATDLIPHGNSEENKRMPLLVFVGVAIFALTDLLFETYFK